MLQCNIGGVLISHTLAFETVGGQTTESVTHGQYDARPTVTFPAAEHHRPLAGTKLYCLVREAHGCEQLAQTQSCCPAMHQPGVEPATSRSQVQLPYQYTTVKTRVLFISVCRPVLTKACMCMSDCSFPFDKILLRSRDIGNQVAQESPADARVTRESAVIPRWPSAAIFYFIEPVIAPFDPPTPRLESNMEWIGCIICEIFTFKLYCYLETGIRGHSRSLKVTLFDRVHMTLY